MNYETDPIPEENIIEEEEIINAEEEAKQQKPAAVTIVIQSWATPIVAVLMLILGFAAGYYGGPLIRERNAPPATAEPAAQVPTDNQAQREALMETVVSMTRHFRGDPEAPVTIIEFSDFQ
ncbi:MAG: hypothetical protein D6803_01210 [Anaerolineae bacterium]|nr:MAG: hypothetical protein D6803_01210 [Anaerolineae bacterium]